MGAQLPKAKVSVLRETPGDLVQYAEFAFINLILI